MSEILPPSTGGQQVVKFIPERDVYRLIISELPSAEKFEEWVVSEVLSSISKNGGSRTKKPPDQKLR